jgi:hypothetical protein
MNRDSLTSNANDKILLLIRKYQAFAKEAVMGAFLHDSSSTTSHHPADTIKYQVRYVPGLYVRARLDETSDIKGIAWKSSFIFAEEIHESESAISIKIEQGWLGPVHSMALVRCGDSLASPIQNHSYERPSAPSDWSCSVCGLFNPVVAHSCVVCCSERVEGQVLSTRGACLAQDCMVRHLQTCLSFEVGAPGEESVCGHCGCDYADHESPLASFADVLQPSILPHHYPNRIICSDAPSSFVHSPTSVVQESVLKVLRAFLTPGICLQAILTEIEEIVSSAMQLSHVSNLQAYISKRLECISPFIIVFNQTVALSSQLQQALAKRLYRAAMTYSAAELDVACFVELAVLDCLSQSTTTAFVSSCTRMINDLKLSFQVNRQLSINSPNVSCLMLSMTDWPTRYLKTCAWKPPREFHLLLSIATSAIHATLDAHAAFASARARVNITPFLGFCELSIMSSGTGAIDIDVDVCQATILLALDTFDSPCAVAKLIEVRF